MHPGDAWKNEYGHYVFRGEGIILDMPEIVVTKHGTAMGPIIPIIPLNKDTNFETQQLEIKITVLGNSD